MEENGQLHQAIQCCSSVSVCPVVSRNLMAMPTTSIRDLCIASNIECGDRDLEFMTKLKDIHQEV
ncbi:hypothetical protein Hanom_Chr07g00670241 [Helianthus anomalus]